MSFAREGEVLGDRWRLVRLLGAGGFGAVFEAEHVRLAGRRVALKVLDPALTRDERLRARFLREVDAASRLAHPNIIIMREVDATPDGLHFCTMDLSPGSSLPAVLREAGGRLAPARAVAIVAQALDALDHAHERGVVHRDVKPDNILVERDPRTGQDVVKVVDFGLAKLLDEEAGAAAFTTTGAVIGTFQYLAPEQAKGERVDGRADQYAAAVVLYELLAGELPFRAASQMAHAMAHMTARPPRLSEAHPELGIPAPLDAAIDRALSKEPAARFPSARAFRDALVATLADARTEVSPGHAQSRPAAPGRAEATVVATAPPPARAASPSGASRGGSTAAGGLRAGERLGRYAIEGMLGGGGMGTVYRARHVYMQRAAALKVLVPELAGDPAIRARFLREAQVASRFRHPAVVELYEFDDQGGLCYLAMELVDGRPLDAVLRSDGPLEPRRVARIFDQLFDALEAAHAAGVVHRDLKPSNVMVCPEDRIKVLDFGIARILEPGSSGGAGPAGGLTKLGEFVGTPAYAAPEQIQGHAVDGRTDLYTAGIMLFEVLAGRRPFDGPPEACLMKHIFEPPPKLSEGRPDLRRVADLDALLARALAKAPEDRFQTASEMRQALLDALGPISPLPGALAAEDAGAASSSAATMASTPTSARTLPGAAAQAAPRAVLAIDGAAGLRRVFLIGGRRLAFGRSRADEKRGVRNDIVLRVLPCRDQRLDPENWAATLRISNAHGEVRIDGGRASIIDRSARGIALDGAPLAKETLTALGDRFALDIAGGALAIEGRVARSEGEVDAVVLRRASNAPEHAYALVASALPVGGGPGAALRLEAPGLAPEHLAIVLSEGAFLVAPAPGARLLMDGIDVPAGRLTPLAPGVRLRAGEAEILFREIAEGDFTTV